MVYRRFVSSHGSGLDEPVLLGRAGECAVVDGVLDRARAGSGGVLLVTGEPGMGKSALLEYAVETASGFQMVRASGVEWEMELAFAGLHQLCVPFLDGLARLPGPQRAAIETAFGLSAGVPADPFFVGLGVLGLLSEAASACPLLCLVDDVQWLDRASARALAVAARRLEADAVALLLAGRELGELGGSEGGRPDRGRDGGEPAGAAGAAARHDVGRAGGRAQVPRDGRAAGPDRGELPAAARGVARGDAAAGAAGRGRAVRGRGAVVAGLRASRDRGGGGGPGRGCGPGPGGGAR